MAVHSSELYITLSSQWHSQTMNNNYNFTVCPRQCRTLRQIHRQVGESVSLCDSSASVLCNSVDAFLAVGHCQVWKEDSLLCQHVDSYVAEFVDAVFRLLPVQCVSTGCIWSNGSLQCLPFALVRLVVLISLIIILIILNNFMSIIYFRSMLPDVIDEAALVRGVRREELFYAYFVFGNKFAGGVTLGISTGIYK